MWRDSGHYCPAVLGFAAPRDQTALLQTVEQPGNIWVTGYDACFFCLGVSAAGMDEKAYRRVTYDLTMSVAATLAKLNPAIAFIYVSGTGTDSTERGA